MDLPQGYLLKRKGSVSILLREDISYDVEESGLFDSPDPLQWGGAAGSLEGGRAGLVRISMGDDGWMVVKRLSRGGWISRINRSLHLSRRRIFQEADLSSYLIGSGVPVAPVILGRAEACGVGFYRLHLGTLEIANRGTLYDLLCHAEESDAATGEAVQEIMFAAGNTVRSLHDAGVLHPDLNLGNLLVARDGVESGKPRITLLDLDRAVLDGRLADTARLANLARLLRHAVKNGFDRGQAFKTLWTFFLKGYCRDSEDAAELEAVVERRFRRSLLFHRLSWALQGK